MIEELRNKARLAILERMQDLFLTQSKIIQDAEEKGVKISSASFSRFLNNNEKHRYSTLTNDQIEWLCSRWCIDITLNVELGHYNLKYSEEKLLAYANKRMVQNRKASPVGGSKADKKRSLGKKKER